MATMAPILLLMILFFTSVACSSSSWQTLSGKPPLVIARGGFSGMFPDSGNKTYNLALAVLTGSPNVALWCDLQLTKDAVGICFPDLKLDTASNIESFYPNETKSYSVNGVITQGWFSVDYGFEQLFNVTLMQDIKSRTFIFDDNDPIMTVEEVALLGSPALWLNVQHNAFYAERRLSVRNFVLSFSRKVTVNYISSPEVNFLQSIKKRFVPRMTKLIFRFLDQDETEPSTNLTYGSLMKNLSYIRTFSSGILVPKSYIWPVSADRYLLPYTSLVGDAHKVGLEVFTSGFANDVSFAFNYSYDPLAESLSFIDNGDFSVDGVLSDFPLTPSQAINCFCHLDPNAKEQAEFSIISKHGASGDYPGCTDLAYQKAVNDGVDILDCTVQMSKDKTPFCLSSIDLLNSTNIAETNFINLSLVVPEIQKGSGIYTFSLTMSQIRSLKPAISNPYAGFSLFRNPRNRNAGKFLTLSEFLSFARNYSSLAGVLISLENAAYLAEHQGISLVDAVLDALKKATQQNHTAPRILIHSSNISVLRRFKEKTNYELVYEVDENIRDILDSAIKGIKKFAGSIIISKRSVFPTNKGFITGVTDVVQKIKSHKLRVYVETFSNEFITQSWDFLSDPTVEIHSFVQGIGIDGIITGFPATAARYRKNRCSTNMSLVPTGELLPLGTPQFVPPAEPPNPILMDSDIMEPPLSAAKQPTTPKPGAPPKGQAKAMCFSFALSSAMLLSSFM